METTLNMFLLACVVFVSGCRCDNQTRKYQTTENEMPRMIHINDLTVTEETLTLDYYVENPFAYDIWICEDIDIFVKLNVETRIQAETLLIKCCFNLENNILLDEAVLAKYRCLSPKDSHLGKILLKLPVRNASPVYDFDEYGRKRKQTVLHQAVFEVGYFEGNFPNMIYESIEEGKRGPDNEELYVGALYLEGILKGRQLDNSSNIMNIPHLWSGLSKEKYTKVIITDIDIPCSVVVNDK